jgi:hypothetical protein
MKASVEQSGDLLAIARLRFTTPWRAAAEAGRPRQRHPASFGVHRVACVRVDLRRSAACGAGRRRVAHVDGRIGDQRLAHRRIFGGVCLRCIDGAVSSSAGGIGRTCPHAAPPASGDHETEGNGPSLRHIAVPSIATCPVAPPKSCGDAWGAMGQTVPAPDRGA